MANNVPAPGVVYSTGYLLGTIVIDPSLSWDQDTETLAAGSVPWAKLPVEASNFPLVMSIPGKPAAGVRAVFSIPQGYQLPANFAGTTTIQDIACTADAVFGLSVKRAGVETAIGTITLLPAGGTAVQLSEQAAFVTQAHDGLVLTLPTLEDATLSGVGISLLLVKM